MKLTGRCKEKFEEWYVVQDYCAQSVYDYGERDTLRHFYAMAIPFKYAVFISFFDSIGIIIEITCDFKVNPVFWLDIDNHEVDGEFNTRLEAQIKSISESNELYNHN